VPQIFGPSFNITAISDHSAKFHGDQTRDLRDFQKKEISISSKT